MMCYFNIRADSEPGVGKSHYNTLSKPSRPLCREVDLPVVRCVAVTGSPEPFFAFPAKSFAMRLRLMVDD